MTEPLEVNPGQAISRRQALRRALVAGGTVAWATPVIQSTNMRNAFAQASPPSLPACRMNGGGWVNASIYGKVTHGFELHCDLSPPNNLEVNWGRRPSHRFHLAVLTSAFCTDDPSIDPDPPPGTGLDTFAGSGTGDYDGQPNATAHWIFTDAGEPGFNDRMKITILDAGGNVVLNVDGTLQGNQQMLC
jgi:hypothetical protein